MAGSDAPASPGHPPRRVHKRSEAGLLASGGPWPRIDPFPTRGASGLPIDPPARPSGRAAPVHSCGGSAGLAPASRFTPPDLQRPRGTPGTYDCPDSLQDGDEYSAGMRALLGVGAGFQEDGRNGAKVGRNAKRAQVGKPLGRMSCPGWTLAAPTDHGFGLQMMSAKTRRREGKGKNKMRWKGQISGR